MSAQGVPDTWCVRCYVAVTLCMLKILSTYFDCILSESLTLALNIHRLVLLSVSFIDKL